MTKRPHESSSSSLPRALQATLLVAASLFVGCADQPRAGSIDLKAAQGKAVERPGPAEGGQANRDASEGRGARGGAGERP